MPDTGSQTEGTILLEINGGVVHNLVVAWTRRGLVAGLLVILLESTTPAQGSCPCDCNDDGTVRVDEITTGVGIALGRLSITQCMSSDPGGDGSVGIADLIGAVDAAIHGCPSDLRAELEENRALWNDGERLSSYRFRIRRGCFCPPPNDIEVTVVDNEVQKIVDSLSGDVIENLDPYFPVTIDAFFELLDDAIDHADLVEVEYHPVFGAPTQIAIDYILEAVDDEVSFQVSDLRSTDDTCRETADCEDIGSQCIEPGGFVGCGVCDDRPSECEGDGDCAFPKLCRVQTRFSCASCDGEPIRTCREACVFDDECPDDYVCGAEGHCSSRRCVSDAGCYPHFECVPISSTGTGSCKRRSCATDWDCKDGFCVNAKCYDRLGQCEVIPP